MEKEVPIFTDYNMTKKFMVMPIFIILCGFPALPIIYAKDIEVICFCLFIEIISLPLTIFCITSHISLYPDRIEIGTWPIKNIILFKNIKKLDIGIVDQTIRYKTNHLLSIIFWGNSGNTLTTIPFKSTSRPLDIISVIGRSNNKIMLSKNLIEYLNENTNYKKK